MGPSRRRESVMLKVLMVLGVIAIVYFAWAKWRFNRDD